MKTDAIEKAQQPSALAQRRETDNLTLAEVRDLGKVFTKSGYFSDVRDEAQAITKILLGKELGFSPIWSMLNIHVIEGKPELSANALASLVQLNEIYDYEVLENTDIICSLRFMRGVKELGISTFTIDDAKRAQLPFKSRKGNPTGWVKWPKAMLFARAMSQGVRTHCPSVSAAGPLYVEGEISSNGAGPPQTEVVQPATGPKDLPPVVGAQEPNVVEGVEASGPEPETPAQSESGDVEYIADGALINFVRSFAAACPEIWSAADMNAARHAWCKSKGFVDGLGEGSSKYIPASGWIPVRNEAEAWAMSVKERDLTLEQAIGELQ